MTSKDALSSMNVEVDFDDGVMTLILQSDQDQEEYERQDEVDTDAARRLGLTPVIRLVGEMA